MPKLLLSVGLLALSTFSVEARADDPFLQLEPEAPAALAERLAELSRLGVRSIDTVAGRCVVRGDSGLRIVALGEPLVDGVLVTGLLEDRAVIEFRANDREESLRAWLFVGDAGESSRLQLLDRQEPEGRFRWVPAPPSNEIRVPLAPPSTTGPDNGVASSDDSSDEGRS